MKLTQKRLRRPSFGGVLATRQGALLMALLCAICAAALLLFALGRYRTNLKTAPPQATVLVATGEIQKGTSGTLIVSRGLFRSTPIVSTQLSAGAISDSALLTGKVAQASILPGQQLTAADFAAVAGVAGQLAPDQRVVSVSIDEAHGDTDVLQAGDRVDIYGSYAENGTQVQVLLIPNAEVIKPSGASIAGSAGSPASKVVAGNSLVLAVSTTQVPMLTYTADNGKLWVVLRPLNAGPPASGITTLKSIINSATALSISNNGTHP